MLGDDDIMGSTLTILALKERKALRSLLRPTSSDFERCPRRQQQVAQDGSLKSCRHGFAIATAGPSQDVFTFEPERDYVLVPKVLTSAAIDTRISRSNHLVRSRFASAEQLPLKVDRYRSLEIIRQFNRERAVHWVGLSNCELIAGI